jgi:hypothetical protein
MSEPEGKNECQSEDAGESRSEGRDKSNRVIENKNKNESKSQS